jgi:hypothetical protein
MNPSESIQIEPFGNDWILESRFAGIPGWIRQSRFKTNPWSRIRKSGFVDYS